MVYFALNTELLTETSLKDTDWDYIIIKFIQNLKISVLIEVSVNVCAYIADKRINDVIFNYDLVEM